MTYISDRREINTKINLDSVLNDDISERIKRVEEYSDIKFPKSYIDFIKKYNVGIPITDKFKFNGNVYVIERFLGFINNYKTSSIGIYDIAVVLSQIDTRLTDNPDLEGDELIPIASLFAGNYLCFDFTKDGENPSICIWDHEESDKFQPVTYKVADSFSEFIEMLS